VSRLLELGVPYYLIRSTLIGVIAQRLIRTFCPDCVEAVSYDQSQWNELIAPWTAKAPEKINKPKGCLTCRDTGFYGRAGIYELLQMTPGMKSIITPEADIEAMRKQAYNDGMRPLRLSGMAKVAKGLTSFEEVLKVAPAPLADS
jgi:general secretion pathway protein E